MAGSGTVRWGNLSTARISQEFIPGVVKSATSDLVAVASRSPEHAAAYAADNCIPVHFGSYEDLLASREIECVYISLPSGLHAESIRKSLQAGSMCSVRSRSRMRSSCLRLRPFATSPPIERQSASARATPNGWKET